MALHIILYHESCSADVTVVMDPQRLHSKTHTYIVPELFVINILVVDYIQDYCLTWSL